MAKPAASVPDFIAIRTGSLAGDTPTTFDTYIKVGSRYILYCRNGDIFDPIRLMRLKQKNIASLYIQKADNVAYNIYLQANIERAYSFDKEVPLEVRAQVVVGYNTELVEKLFENIGDPDVYREGRSSSSKLVDFICNEPQSIKAIMDVTNEDSNIAQHGVRVASLAVALANEMKLIDNGRPIPMLALGCFLHDLEHAYTGFDCVRPIAFLTKEEFKEYKKHPLNGAAKVQALGHMDNLVQQIILQHEEHADGTGFPKGLTQDDMDPLILVAGAANAFDRLVTFEKQNPKDALKNLLIEKMGAYPLPMLQAMQRLLKEKGVIAA